ncbi:MAG: hypothetical protein DRJ26_02930 [Candidatus Methanomethylicota archaeon]|uniref:Uncharacterized protein n=1 Tax=Thermoproteota archaeon TaxID=2056631 RepID=A0A497F272_9CREN|nr:MAG: hypothetical protein DRJ26_02930 [Candidatus Verstraetearchaeota archaeon]
MNYHQVLEVLRDGKVILKCSKCGGPLEICKVYSKNFMKPNEEIYASMLCFNCGFEHEFKLLSPGVWGLLKVKNVKVHSIEEYLEKFRGEFVKEE